MNLFTKLILGTSVLVLSACTQGANAPGLDAKTVHDNVITLDTHVDIPLNYMTDEMDPGTGTDAQVDLGKMETGGLDAAFFIIYTPQTDIKDGLYEDARKIAETRYLAIEKLVTKYAGRIELAKSADDVRRIHKAGKRVALIGIENAFPLGESVDDVQMWAERGVRYMGITHFGHNQFGDSSNPNPEAGETDSLYGGLSPLGKELVIALNKAGIMVDVSHAGRETMMQATALSRVPVIASHSGVKAVADSARNLDDEQLRVLAQNGGVAQMVALGAYVKTPTPEQTAFVEAIRKDMGLETRSARSAMDEETEALYKARVEKMYEIAPRATVADFVDHIDHAVKISGIDHVGIASDFDGGGGVEGWDDASETLNVTIELIKRGYSQDDIAKIWGGNLLRVLEAVENGADQ